MGNKQTAVDWVFDKIIRCYEEEEWIRLIEEAKQMEKEQMRDLFLIGDEDGFKRCYYHNNHNDIDFDEYYNETYGN